MPQWAYLGALAAIALVSRLPQLLTPNLLLDGDECILGLMAHHLADGREFPIFFYGQNYGLAIVEAPIAALSFLILGMGAVALKLAMLTVWVAGVCLYYLAFSRPLGNSRSFWITLLLVLMPAWAVSSMKAWSGYITAFSTTGAILYLLTPHDDHPRSPRWVIAGTLTTIVYLSQASWLPGLLPIVAIVLLASRRAFPWVAYFSGLTGAMVLISVLRFVVAAGGIESWARPSVGNPDLLGSIPALWRQVFVNLTGSYFLGSPVKAGPFTTVAASVWLGILALTSSLQIYRLITRRYLFWSHVLFISVLSTLVANWVLLDSRHARYLLSMNAPLVFLAGIEMFDLGERLRISSQRLVGAIVLVLTLQGVSMLEFSRFTYMWWENPAGGRTETATLRDVVNYMKSRGATRAFSTNALLQWQITFYSHEDVIARWTADVDRYPPYIKAVDRALDRGDPVAIVGYTGYTGGIEHMVPEGRALVDFDGKYFVLIGPDKELLRRARFRFGSR